MSESNIFTIFQYNGKDLFLQDVRDPDRFVVKSFFEIPTEYHRRLVSGREVELDAAGKMNIRLTPAEIEVDRVKNQRIASLRKDIAAIEAGVNLPEYAVIRLANLRRDLAELVDLDPTAITLEQQRANESIGRPTYILPKDIK